jgi:hypothetical protein
MPTLPLHPAAATKAILEAYDPQECDQCEGKGSTCWECAEDALDSLRNAADADPDFDA